MKTFRPLIVLLAMTLSMLWPHTQAQAQTAKTVTFTLADNTTFTQKKIVVPADGETLTIEFDKNNLGDQSTYFNVNSSGNTRASFTLGEGKRIKNVLLKGSQSVALVTGLNYSTLKSSSTSYLKFYKELTGTTTSADYKFSDATGGKTWTETITIVAADNLIYGSANPLVVQFASTLGNSSSKLAVYTVEITYYDESELPKDNTLTYGLEYASPIQYINNPADGIDWATANWTTAEGFAPISLDGSTVLVKIGNTVTTFKAPTSKKPATVIIDPAKHLVGATAGASFFTQLYSQGANDKLYRVEYLYNYKTAAYALGYQKSSANLSNASTIGYNFSSTTSKVYYQAPNIAFAVQPATAPVTADNATFTVKTSSLTNIFTGTANDASLTAGKQMCVAFDGIRVSYTSPNEVKPDIPKAPTVTVPDDAILGTDGVYKLLSGFELTPAMTEENVKVQYRFDSDPFTDLGADAKITVDKSCVLEIKAVSTADAKESGVLRYKFEKLDILTVDDVTKLTKADEGKLVRINTALQVLATGTYPANNKVLHIHTRDSQDNPVHIVSRSASAVTSSNFAALTPGPAFQTYGSQSNLLDRFKITNQRVIPAGGTIGTLQFENDKPVIVLKDETADAPIDNISLCYTGATANNLKLDNGKIFVQFTYTQNPRTEIKAEDLGRAISIVATYNSDGKYYTGGSPEPLDVRTDDGFITCLPQYSYTKPSISPTADTKYTLSGLVAYDAANGKYYLMPRTIVAYSGEINVALNESAEYSKFVKPADGNPAEIYIEGSKFKVDITGHIGTANYYLVKKANTGSGSITNIAEKQTNFNGTYTPEVNITELPEGGVPLELDFYLLTLPTSTGNEPTDYMAAAASHYYMNVYAAASGAEDYESIAALLAAAKAEPAKLNGTYVRLKGNTMAVAALNNNRTASSPTTEYNSMILKDISPLIEGKENVELPALPLRFNQSVGQYQATFQPNATAVFDSKQVEVGDKIAEIVLKVSVDEQGNVTGDISKTANFYKSYKSDFEPTDPNYVEGLGAGKPLFTRYIPAMTRTPRLEPAEGEQGAQSIELTAEHIDKVVTIAKVSITPKAAVEPGIATLADGDAEYVAKLKHDVPLKWDIFPSTASTALHRTTIGALSSGDATYTITGLVRADQGGGHFIEVLELTPDYGTTLAVCDHEQHATYWDTDNEKVNFKPAHYGTAVMMKGMKLTEDAGTYKTQTRQPVTLNFDNVTNQKAAWQTLAATAVAGNLPVRLTGVLRNDDTDGLVLDVLTYENVTAPGRMSLTLNGTPYMPNVAQFISGIKLGYEAPEGAQVMYSVVTDPDAIAPVLGENPTEDEINAHTDAIKAELAKADNIKPFTEETDLTLLDNAWVRLEACAPGEGDIRPLVMELKKNSIDANTIADINGAKNEDDTELTSGYFHVRKPWLITATGNGRAMATDGSGKHVALLAAADALPEAGKHISEFGVQKGNSAAAGAHRYSAYAFALSGNDLDRITVEPDAAIAAPAATDLKLGNISTNDHSGMLVALTDAVLTGNATDGYTIKARATAGQPADKDLLEDPRYKDQYDFTTPRDIRINNILGVNLGALTEGAKYRLVGYAMLSTDQVQPGNLDTSGAPDYNQSIVEFWPASEPLCRVKIQAVPVITLSAAKSTKAETATIAFADGADTEGLTIEYSVDGGTTWRPYTAELALSKSATIQARATSPWLDPSDVATASFTMQHKSAAPLASFTEAEGVTTVTLTTSREGAAAGSYKVYYTTDGTEPTTASTLYADPFQVKKAGVKLRAILLENDPEAAESDPVEWTVPFTPAKQPENPDQPVTPDKSGSVTMTHRTDQDGTVWVELKAPAGADVEAIYYTTDGTTPTESSAAYVGEIKLTKTATVKAVLKERGKTLGDVVSREFTVTTTGIDGIGSDATGGVSVDGNSIIAPVGSQAYDMTGRRVSLTGLRQGVYIVRLPDGTALKVSIR